MIASGQEGFLYMIGNVTKGSQAHEFGFKHGEVYFPNPVRIFFLSRVPQRRAMWHLRCLGRAYLRTCKSILLPYCILLIQVIEAIDGLSVRGWQEKKIKSLLMDAGTCPSRPLFCRHVYVFSCCG